MDQLMTLEDAVSNTQRSGSLATRVLRQALPIPIILISSGFVLVRTFSAPGPVIYYNININASTHYTSRMILTFKFLSAHTVSPTTPRRITAFETNNRTPPPPGFVEVDMVPLAPTGPHAP